MRKYNKELLTVIESVTGLGYTVYDRRQTLQVLPVTIGMLDGSIAKCLHIKT
jgi:hypothetical protein